MGKKLFRPCIFEGNIGDLKQVVELLEAADKYWDSSLYFTILSADDSMTLVLRKPTENLPEGMYPGDYDSFVHEARLNKNVNYPESDEETESMVLDRIMEFSNKTSLEIIVENEDIGRNMNGIMWPNLIELPDFREKLIGVLDSKKRTNTEIKGHLYSGLLYRPRQLKEFNYIATGYSGLVETTISSYPESVSFLVKQDGTKQHYVGISTSKFIKARLDKLDEEKKIDIIRNQLLRIFKNYPAEFTVRNQSDEKKFSEIKPTSLSHILAEPQTRPFDGFISDISHIGDVLNLCDGYWDDYLYITVLSESDSMSLVLENQQKDIPRKMRKGDAVYNVHEVRLNKDIDSEQIRKEAINNIIHNRMLEFSNSSNLRIVIENEDNGYNNEKSKVNPPSLSLGTFLLYRLNGLYDEGKEPGSLDGCLCSGWIYRTGQLEKLFNLIKTYADPKKPYMQLTFTSYPESVRLLLEEDKGAFNYVKVSSNKISKSRLDTFSIETKEMKKGGRTTSERFKIISDKISTMFRNFPVEFRISRDYDEKYFSDIEPVNINSISLDSARNYDEGKNGLT